MTRSLLLASAALAGLPMAALAAPRVVTDLPPVGALVAQVMQGVGTPEVLLTDGTDGHHHQLRPSEARQVAGADLLVWMGPQMTPWLDAAADTLASGQGLALLEVPDTHLHAGHEHHHGEGDDHGHADGDHDHDHADEEHEHEHAEGEDHDHAEGEEHHHDHADAAHGHDPAASEGGDHGHDHDGHDHGGIDPHAWLDPANAQRWLDVIAEALAAQDPDNAETYRANAAEGRAAIDAAVAEARAILAGHDSRFVVSHDALGYFTEAMNLPPALALAGLTDNAPSAGTLRRLRREIADAGAACMHPEAGKDPRAFTSLDGLGLQLGAPLDILGTTQGEAVSYPALLTGLARAIADCPAGG